MTFEEKNTWIYLVIATVLPVIYFTVVLSEASTTPVGDIAYVQPMLFAIGAAIVFGILGSIALAIATRGADKKDERDVRIQRTGDVVGFYVASISTLVPLALAMTEAEHFWIANTLYLSFVLAAIVSSIVRIVLYRRGF